MVEKPKVFQLVNNNWLELSEEEERLLIQPASICAVPRLVESGDKIVTADESVCRVITPIYTYKTAELMSTVDITSEPEMIRYLKSRLLEYIAQDPRFIKIYRRTDNGVDSYFALLEAREFKNQTEMYAGDFKPYVDK